MNGPADAVLLGPAICRIVPASGAESVYLPPGDTQTTLFLLYLTGGSTQLVNRFLGSFKPTGVLTGYWGSRPTATLPGLQSTWPVNLFSRPERLGLPIREWSRKTQRPHIEVGYLFVGGFFTIPVMGFGKLFKPAPFSIRNTQRAAKKRRQPGRLFDKRIITPEHVGQRTRSGIGERGLFPFYATDPAG